MKKIMIYRVLLIATSLPLAFLGYIYALSGYGLIKPGIVETITFGLMDRYTCFAIHTSPLIRVMLLTLAIVHGYTGYALLIQIVKNPRTRLILEILLALIAIAIYLQFILLELA